MDTEPLVDTSPSPELSAEPPRSELTVGSPAPVDGPVPPGPPTQVPPVVGTTHISNPVHTAPAILPKTPEVPLTATSVGTTSPIASAIRNEIRTLVNVEVLELQLLNAVIQVARSGRDLVAVRNPTMRFDAKAQGLGTEDPCAMPYAGNNFVCGPEDMGDYDHWEGPAIRDASERRKKDISDALRESPVAIAVKAELLELTETEPFGPSELLQVEQLAMHAHRVLSAALGLRSDASGSHRVVNRMSGGGIVSTGNFAYGQNPMSPSSSPETFGAKMSREMIAAAKTSAVDPEKLVLAIALARQKGLDDVSGKLEEQLGIQPSPQSKPQTKREEA